MMGNNLLTCWNLKRENPRQLKRARGGRMLKMLNKIIYEKCQKTGVKRLELFSYSRRLTQIAIMAKVSHGNRIE